MERLKTGPISYKIISIKAYFEQNVLNYICNKISLRMAWDIFSFRVIYKWNISDIRTVRTCSYVCTLETDLFFNFSDSPWVAIPIKYVFFNSCVKERKKAYFLCCTHTWTHRCITHGTYMGTIHLSRNLADAHINMMYIASARKYYEHGSTRSPAESVNKRFSHK